MVSDPIFGTRFLRPSPEFQSALRFAVVSDEGHKEWAVVGYLSFQSALRFAVVSDVSIACFGLLVYLRFNPL